MSNVVIPFFSLKSVYCIRLAHVYVCMNVECKVFQDDDA